MPYYRLFPAFVKVYIKAVLKVYFLKGVRHKAHILIFILRTRNKGRKKYKIIFDL